jgi:hypothetical protein
MPELEQIGQSIFYAERWLKKHGEFFPTALIFLGCIRHSYFRDNLAISRNATPGVIRGRKATGPRAKDGQAAERSTEDRRAAEREEKETFPQ